MSVANNPTLFPTPGIQDPISPAFAVIDEPAVPANPSSLPWTPTAVNANVGPNIPDPNFPAPPTTPNGTLSGTPGSVGVYGAYPYQPSFDQAIQLPVWSSAVTYAIQQVVGFSVAAASIPAWASGTTYAKNNLVKRTVTGGLLVVFASNAAGNLGNDPASYSAGASFASEAEDPAGEELDFEFWTPVATYADADINNAGNFFVGFISLIASNLNNSPFATVGTDWNFAPSNNSLSIGREGGPLTFPALAFPAGVETETWLTSNFFGGTGNSTVTRADFSSPVVSISAAPGAASFLHTTTQNEVLTLKDAAGNSLTAGGFDGATPVPGWTATSGTPATCTVPASGTGNTVVITGVAVGTSLITITVGGRSVSFTVTCT